jgi:hypothetical protein
MSLSATFLISLFLAFPAMAGSNCESFYGGNSGSSSAGNTSVARLARILETQEVDSAWAIEQVAKNNTSEELQMHERETLNVEFKKALADRPSVTVDVLKSVVKDLRSINFFMGPYHEDMVQTAIEYAWWSRNTSIEKNIQRTLIVSRSTKEEDVREKKLIVDSIVRWTLNDLKSIDELMVTGIGKTPEARLQRHFKYIHPRMNRSVPKLKYFIETLKDITQSPEKTEALKLILENSLYDMTRVIYHRHLGNGSKVVGHAVGLTTTFAPFAAAFGSEIILNQHLFESLGNFGSLLPVLTLAQGIVSGLFYGTSVADEASFGKSLGARPVTELGGKFTLPGKESLVFLRRWKQMNKNEKDLVAQIIYQKPKEVKI